MADFRTGYAARRTILRRVSRGPTEIARARVSVQKRAANLGHTANWLFNVAPAPSWVCVIFTLLLVVTLTAGEAALLHAQDPAAIAAAGKTTSTFRGLRHYSRDLDGMARLARPMGARRGQTDIHSIACPGAPVCSTDVIAATANIAILPSTEQSDNSGNLGNLGDFKRSVEARYKAARNGTIEILLPGPWKSGEAVTVKVLINRAPEGADGLTIPQATNKAVSFTGLLKVDDEMSVKLSSAETASVVIEAARPETHAIRHILPGGHAEWIWHVRFLGPGEKHLTVNADVVYRRNFLLYEPPMVTFDSATVPVKVQVLP